MPASWSIEAQLLVLRGVVLLLLYLFIALLVMVVAGSLRRAATATRPATPGSKLGHLILVEPGPSGLEAGTSFPLAAVSSIGRAMRNTVSVDDEFLSLEHSLLSWRDGTWWIEDLGSTNGTSVNGVRISRVVPVTVGDLIEVGRVALRLE